MLIGTKLDLREDKEHHGDNQSTDAVSMTMGLTMQAKNNNVVKYLECSALTNYGLKEVFEEAMMAGWRFRNNPANRQKCCIA